MRTVTFGARICPEKLFFGITEAKTCCVKTQSFAYVSGAILCLRSCLPSFSVRALYLDEGCFLLRNRQGDMTLANRALKLPPIAAALKPSVYDCAALGALRIRVPIAVVIFSYELSFRHEGVSSIDAATHDHG